MASTSSSNTAHSGGGITRLRRSATREVDATAGDESSAIYTLHEHKMAYTYPEHKSCQEREIKIARAEACCRSRRVRPARPGGTGTAWPGVRSYQRPLRLFLQRVPAAR